MKKTLVIVLVAYAVISTFTCGYLFNSHKALKEENEWLSTQYSHAYNACVQVAEFGDSTADTGEFDEFIQSANGQMFWHEFNLVNEEQ